MSTEESILEEVRAVLEADADLITYLGGPPAAFYWKAIDNQRPPYIIYKLEDVTQVDNCLYDGTLSIELWFYTTNASVPKTVEELIISLFDGRYIYNDNVSNFRMTHDTEGRKNALPKPLTGNKNGLIDNKYTFLCINWYCRWVSIPRLLKRIQT